MVSRIKILIEYGDGKVVEVKGARIVKDVADILGISEKRALETMIRNYWNMLKLGIRTYLDELKECVENG